MSEQLELERRLVGDATASALLREMWTILQTGSERSSDRAYGLPADDRCECDRMYWALRRPSILRLTNLFSLPELLRSSDFPEHGDERCSIIALRHRRIRHRRSPLPWNAGTGCEC